MVWSANFDLFVQAHITTPAATSDSPTITSQLRLPGQIEDAESGLHYNYRRYYDPSTGRYITQDPIGIDGGLNQYRYADSDPVNLMDPRGENPLLAYGACVAACMLLDAVMGECPSNCLMGCIPVPAIAAWRRLPPCVQDGILDTLFNSFPGDTLVHVKPANASEHEAQQGKTELKPISQLNVGDQVLAYSEWKAEDQRLSYEKVADIFTSYKQQNLITLTLDNGDILTVTEHHPFKTPDGWRDAVLLKKGGQLLLKDGATTTITDVKTEQRVLPVYNLEVANAHTYFVGVGGELVHNNSRKLGQSLNKNGQPRPSSEHEAAHGIPTGDFSDRSQEVQDSIKKAQNIADKYSPGCRDSFKNGFWALPGHLGTHRDEFLKGLGDRFKNVRGLSSLEKALAKMIEDIKSGMYDK